MLAFSINNLFLYLLKVMRKVLLSKYRLELLIVSFMLYNIYKSGSISVRILPSFQSSSMIRLFNSFILSCTDI